VLKKSTADIFYVKYVTRNAYYYPRSQAKKQQFLSSLGSHRRQFPLFALFSNSPSEKIFFQGLAKNEFVF